MSVTLHKPISEETAKAMRKMLGCDEPVATDLQQFLFDNIPPTSIGPDAVKSIEKITLCEAKIQTHQVGDIVTMSDGTKYEVTSQGWKKQKEQ